MSNATKAAVKTPVGSWAPPNQVLPLTAVMKEGEETVTMISPRAFVLTISHSCRVQVKAGVQEVPVHLAKHFYLVGHGVKPYNPETGKAKQDPTPVVVADPQQEPDGDEKGFEVTEDMVRFVQLRNVPIESVEGLQAYLDNLTPTEFYSFKVDFEAWKASEDAQQQVPDPTPAVADPTPAPAARQPKPRSQKQRS